MLKQRRAVAQRVINCLNEAEKGIDIAFTSASDLVGMLPAARLEAGVAAEIGHEALEQAVAATNALLVARGAMVEAHRALAKAQVQVGLRAVSFGGLMPKAAELTEMPSVANAA